MLLVGDHSAKEPASLRIPTIPARDSN
jgi:hypothetical protein